MIGLVLAVCLTIAETPMAPTHQICSLRLVTQQFETTQKCEAVSKVFIPNVIKNNKKLKIDTHKCIDLNLLSVPTINPNPVPPPASNSVDPALKPITPEQSNKGFQSF